MVNVPIKEISSKNCHTINSLLIEPNSKELNLTFCNPFYVKRLFLQTVPVPEKLNF